MIILNREFYKYLLEWKSISGRKPMLLKGARQVGKTFCKVNLSGFDGKTEV